VLEEAHRHLATAGVVHAQEQHDGAAVVAESFDPGLRGQLLPRETLGQQRQEVRHSAVRGELVVARVQEALDGLGAVHAVELAAQAHRGGV
jgi:hypothetical protein